MAEAPMPDGVHRLRLIKAEYGPYVYRSKNAKNRQITRLITNVMPRRWRFPFQQVVDISVSTTSPAFLFGVVNSKGHFDGSTVSSFQGEFVDSTGFRFFNDSRRYTTNVFTLEANCLPRRDKHILLKVVGIQAAAPLGEMKIENPFFQPNISEWVPRTDDRVQERSQLKVQLIGFSIKPPSKLGSNASQWFSFPPEINVESRISSSATEWTGHWTKSWIEDATGNRGNWLSPQEPAWKAVIEVSRYSKAPHPAEMITPIGTYRIPPPGQIAMLNQSIDHMGFKLRIRCICGGGNVTLSNGIFSVSGSTGSGMRSSRIHGNGVDQESISFGKPFLWVDQHSRPENRRFIFRRKDGDEIHLPSSGQQGNGIALPVADGEKEISIELVDSRPERFEFMVTPPESLKEEMLEVCEIDWSKIRIGHAPPKNLRIHPIEPAPVK